MHVALFKDLKSRMGKAVGALQEDMNGVRTGRASTSILENIIVNAYGQDMAINQLATLSVPEPRMISVQPWDKGTMTAIEKAIRESDLGLNPLNDGQVLRVPLPELTEERRKEMVKLVHKYGEQAKIAVRNIRRDGMDQLKRAEKNKEISQDDLRTHEKTVQELTDTYVKEVDGVIESKEKDVMQV
ncbi:MAG: ribosome recycling factor [Magnetococcales bacterium]|nr:ribosome recycling factor [Magnetococcales bacterium]